MKRSNKVIITCAVTGSIHTPTMSPHLPITPDEIAEQAIAAAERRRLEAKEAAVAAKLAAERAAAAKKEATRARAQAKKSQRASGPRGNG